MASIFQDPYAMQMLGLGMLARSGFSRTPQTLGQIMGGAGMSMMPLLMQKQWQDMREKIIEKRIERIDKELKRREKLEKLREKLGERIAGKMASAEGPFSDEQAAMLIEQAGEFANPSDLGQIMLQGGVSLGDPYMMRSGLGLMAGPEQIMTKEIPGLGSVVYTQNALGNIGGMTALRSDPLQQLQAKLMEQALTQQEETAPPEDEGPGIGETAAVMTKKGIEWLSDLFTPEEPTLPPAGGAAPVGGAPVENPTEAGISLFKELGQKAISGIKGTLESAEKRQVYQWYPSMVKSTVPWELRSYIEKARKYLPEEYIQKLEQRLKELEKEKGREPSVREGLGRLFGGYTRGLGAYMSIGK